MPDILGKRTYVISISLNIKLLAGKLKMPRMWIGGWGICSLKGKFKGSAEKEIGACRKLPRVLPALILERILFNIFIHAFCAKIIHLLLKNNWKLWSMQRKTGMPYYRMQMGESLVWCEIGFSKLFGKNFCYAGRFSCEIADRRIVSGCAGLLQDIVNYQ